MIDRLLVLGDGDVTTRFVLPAVAELLEAERLPDDFRVDVLGRHERSGEAYLGDVEHAEGVSARTRELLVERVRHHCGDATEAADLEGLVGDEPIVAYLALPPAVFGPAAEALGAAGLAEGSRLAVEKPFGTDLASARELNRVLQRCVPEESIFRIDHFLGLRTAHNVLATRFANRVLAPAWSDEHIAEVEITWDEAIDLDGRTGYYDGIGELRDMTQNHLLQLLCLVAIEPPPSFCRADLSAAKVDVLRATGIWDGDIAASTVRGRYRAGTLQGREVASYLDLDRVDPDHGTETFASVTLQIDTDRWRRTPFVLRSGKALRDDRHEVVVRFRATTLPVGMGGDTAPAPNVLRFTVDPDGVRLELEMASGDAAFDLEPVEVRHDLGDDACSPYALLLCDILAGSSALSVSAEEAEASWQVIEPILSAWADDVSPIIDYPAGSDGAALRPPTGADEAEVG